MDSSREKKIEKADLLFLGALLVFALFCVVRFYEGRMNVQNTTAYVFNYTYGLLPRGFVGTLIYVTGELTHRNLCTYENAMRISAAATGVLFVLIFLLYGLLLSKVKKEQRQTMYIIIVLASVVLFPEYLTWNNFGRTDEYLMMGTVFCLILLVAERLEWLIIPVCAVMVLVHEGFVFTNAGLILAILFYKCMTGDKKKYGIILLLSFLCMSMLFSYFAFFREPVSVDVYREIEAHAKETAEGMKHFNDAYSLLDSELLVESVYEAEAPWRQKNRAEFPLFILLFLPYIIMTIRFMAGIITEKKEAAYRLTYLGAFLGILTIVPEYILKVDYGRWVFCTIIYIVFIIMVLVAAGDEAVCKRLSSSKWANVMLSSAAVYLFLFVPFRDVYISDITTAIMDRVAQVLHLW